MMTSNLSGRANRRRGEVEAVFNGERKIPCLTLGALALLETAFEAEDLMALAVRFSSGRFKSTDLIKIISAGLRGAGNISTDEDVKALAMDDGIAGFVNVVEGLLTATFIGTGDVGISAMPINPIKPQQT